MIKQINRLNKKSIFFPRKLFFSFLVITLLMFALSPWDWPPNNQLAFYLLNILYILSFFIGYKFGVIRFKLKRKVKSFRFSKIFTISLILNVLFLYQKFLFKTKLPSLSINQLLTKITIGFSEPSLVYAEKHLTENSDFATLSNPIVLLYFLLLPLLYLSIPLGIFYWERTKRWQKVLLIIIIIGDILSYIAIGTNKGIFDYIITIPILVLAKRHHTLLNKRISKKKLVYIAIFGILFISGTQYFVKGNKGRKKDDFRYDTSINQYINNNAVVLKILPEFFQDPYIALDSYLTQGYYAMSLALNLDYKPTYGLGHSSFLTSISDKFFEKNYIKNRTYQERIEDAYGYSANGKWHSIYTWIANDMTFIGVIFFVFFVGFYLAQIWLDSIINYNPYAIILLPLFCIMIFYFSANNQVLGNQGSSLIFWTFFLIWLRNKGNKIVYV